MKRRLLLTYLLITNMFLRQITYADPIDPFFLQHYDNRNGLSNSSINNIFKDSGNLLWIATWDGLNMFDGNTFHVFNYSKENDFKSIGSNVIQQIKEDQQGNIWASTIEGISRYEKKTGRFFNYFYDRYHRGRVSEQEYALAVDLEGNIFCLNQKTGLNYYDAQIDSFLVCKLPGQKSAIVKVLFDETNRLWLLGADGKLTVYAVNQHRFTKLNSFSEKDSIVNFFLVNHQVFYLTAGNVLYSVQKKLPKRTLVMQGKYHITAFNFYKGHYIAALSSKGLEVYDDKWVPSEFLKEEKEQMEDIRVTSLTLGSEDILWLGTDGNGLIKIYPKTKSFGTVSTASNGMPYNKSVRAFCETDGDLWVGTKGAGIISFQNFWGASPQDTRRNYTAPKHLANNSVYALTKGNDNLVYIGTDGKGIDVYDISTRQFNKWSTIKGHDAYPEFGSVYAIKQDPDNSLWLGTSGYGLIHLRIEKDGQGKLTLNFLERFIFRNNNTGPANDIIYSLADGDADFLWVGCRYGGLSLLNKKTLVFKTFKAQTYNGSLSNNDVLSLFKDSRNRIWIGTSYGLNWINNADGIKEEPLFRKLTTAEGLPNNTIHAIQQEKGGYIWVSTNKGLAKVSQENLKVSYYQQMDGLQSDEFCDGAAWKDATGEIFFGGTYGFNHFRPENILKSGWQPNLLLSGIFFGDKNIGENGLIVLDPSVNKPLDFSISRKDNYFELNIKALSYLNSEKCEYAYFLEGYDKAWHYAGTNGKILYSNIPPGNYSFKVKWSNGEGLWTGEMAMINLDVKQYFWLTLFAFLVYAIVLSFIVTVIYRYRKNKLEIKHQLQVEHLLREKEEEIHQNRLGFFTNIAHELQTPLTLIMGSVERYLDKPPISKEQKDKPYFLSLIHQQAARLTYLVHQLLEFRKAEEGFYKNEYSQLNISELLQNLGEPFVPLSQHNKMEYELSIAPGMIGWADKDKLEKIIFNLLSNAFKHSGKKEKVIFAARENEATEALEIEVTNSGCNLTKGKLDRIFDKFYTGKDNISDSENFGTGIGLAFTRQLVTLLNGSIQVANPNHQITFKVCLPLLRNVPAGISCKSTSSYKPSDLYQTITAYNTPSATATLIGNNKLAIIENLKDNNRKSILVVEDDPDIRYLLNDILKEEYIIYEAEDGVKALELAEKIIPDLVVCDVMMPNMGGLELCNRMKDAPATCHIPFIILSARGSEEHHMEGYESGADAYIAKPFNSANLKLRIRKLLEYRQKLKELFTNNRNTDGLANADFASGDKDFLTKLIKVIDENINESELNAVFLEKSFHMSKMQLYRKMKTLSGMTPGEFIKHIRLKTAAGLLVSTNLNVTEIFYQTGFNNQSYFFREFKKCYNCAPNEYRDQQTIPGFK